MAQERIDIVVSQTGATSVIRDIKEIGSAGKKADADTKVLKNSLEALSGAGGATKVLKEQVSGLGNAIQRAQAETQVLKNSLVGFTSVRPALEKTENAIRGIAKALRDAKADTVPIGGSSVTPIGGLNESIEKLRTLRPVTVSAATELRTLRDALLGVLLLNLRNAQGLKSALEFIGSSSLSASQKTALLKKALAEVSAVDGSRILAAARGVDGLSVSLEKLSRTRPQATVRETKDEIAKIAPAADRSAAALSALRTILFSIGGGFGIREVFRELDRVSQIKTRIEAIAVEGENTSQTFRKLAGAANETRSPLDDTVRLYQRVGFTLQALGKTTDETIRVTTLLSKAYQLSGATANEAAQSARQFTQALNRGRLGEQELNSVLEEGPGLSRAIAEGFRLTEAELEKLNGTGNRSRAFFDAQGKQLDVGTIITNRYRTAVDSTGKAVRVLEQNTTDLATKQKLSADLFKRLSDNAGVTVADLKVLSQAEFLTGTRITEALERSGKAIDQRFAKIPVTLTQAVTVVRNQLDILFLKFDEQTGVVGKLGDLILTFGNNTELLAAALTALATIAIPLAVIAIGKLTIALVGSGLGIFLIALGSVTGLLVKYRNDIGLAADGTLTFSKAVFSLADGFALVGRAFANAKPGDISKAFAIPLPDIKAQGKKIVDEFERVKGAINGSTPTVGVRPAPSVGIFDNLVTGLGGPLAVIPQVEKLIQEKTRLSDLEDRTVNQNNRVAESLGKVTEAQVRARATRLEAADTKQFNDSLGGFNPLANGIASILKLSEKKQDFDKLARSQLQVELKENQANKAVIEEQNRLLKLKKEAVTAIAEVKPVSPVAELAKAPTLAPIGAAEAFSSLRKAATDTFTDIGEKAKAVGVALPDSLFSSGVAAKAGAVLFPAITKVAEVGTAAFESGQKVSATISFAERLDGVITGIRRGVASTIGFILGAGTQLVVELEESFIRVFKALVLIFDTALERLGLIKLGIAELSAGENPISRILEAGRALADKESAKIPATTFFSDAATSGALGQFLTDIASKIGGVGKALDAVQPKVDDLIDPPKKTELNFFQQLSQGADNFATLLTSTFSNIENAIVNFTTTGKLNFKSFVNAMIADITRFAFRALILKPLLDLAGASTIGQNSSNSTNFLKQAGRGLSQFLGGGLGGLFGGGASAASNFVGPLQQVSAFATGGLITGPGGPTSDSLLARLSPGEFVVNADATKNNRGLLDFVNAGGSAGETKSGGVVFAPTINVTVQSSGSDDAAQGQAVANQLKTVIQAEFTRLLRQQTRPGGLLQKDKASL